MLSFLFRMDQMSGFRAGRMILAQRCGLPPAEEEISRTGALMRRACRHGVVSKRRNMDTLDSVVSDAHRSSYGPMPHTTRDSTMSW